MDDVLEAVVLSSATGLGAQATDNEDGVVVIGQSLHGGVGLDELIGRDGVLEDLRKLLATGGLGLATAIGQEDVRDLDTQLVVAIEHPESLLGLLDGFEAVAQDTIDVERESHVLSSSDLLLGHILDLRCQDVAGDGGAISLDGGMKARHARRSGDGERSAKGVPGSTAVLHRGRQAQVVHELSCIADRAPRGGNLNCVARIIGDRKTSTSALALVPRGVSSRGAALDSKIGVVKARHGDKR